MTPSNNTAVSLSPMGKPIDSDVMERAIQTVGSAQQQQNHHQKQDLNAFAQDLLEQMGSRFTKLGDSIIGRMDEMGNRMDELERSIAELMDEVGLEPPSGKNNVGISTMVDVAEATSAAASATKGM